MTAPTLIERGAIALLRKEFPQREWNRLPPFAQSGYLEKSRTCLEAFRKPTEKMVVAGVKVMSAATQHAQPHVAVIFGQPKDVWQAMADAELDTGT